jgi:hypothetical protein
LVRVEGPALHRVNPALPESEIEQIVRSLAGTPHPTLVEKTCWFRTLLSDGVEVGEREGQDKSKPGGGELQALLEA